MTSLHEALTDRGVEAEALGPTESRALSEHGLVILRFTAENGAIRVVPGSHRQVQPLLRSMRQPQARHPDEMPVLPEAGSVLVFDGHLWHAGDQNRSGARRRSYQVQFVALDSAPPADLPDTLPEHLGASGRIILGAS